MLDNDTLLKQQYDVLAGHWPENKNEVVLVVDKNNEISDFTLYTLGLRDSKELSDMVSTILAGGEAPELEHMVFHTMTFLISSLRLCFRAICTRRMMMEHTQI